MLYSLRAVIAMAGSGSGIAAHSDRGTAAYHGPYAESGCAVSAMLNPDPGSESPETFLSLDSETVFGDTTSNWDAHPQKKCVKIAVREPVVVKKCTYKIKLKTVYKTYCTSVSHSH